MLTEIVAKARKRLLLNEVVKQFAVSALIGIGALAVLLTVGTRYLEWWIVVLIAVAGIGWAANKLRNRIPGEYAAAVWLDTSAGLHDSISTAHYFTKNPAKAAGLGADAANILQKQLGEAERLAGTVDVAVNVPFRFPKSLYALAGLLVVSSGLVGVRYFYGSGLNISAPITEVVFQDLAAARPPKAGAPGNKKQNSDGYEEAQSLLQKLGFVPNLTDKPDEKLDEALADALKSPVSSPGSPDAPKLDDQQQNGDPLEEQPQGQKGDSNTKTSDGKPGSQNPDSSGQPGQKGQQGEKSLLSKLKDAMDDMLGAGGPQGDKQQGAKGQQSQSKPSSGAQTSQAGEDGGEEQNKMSAAEGEANGQAQKGQTQGKSGGDQSEKQEGPSAAGSGDGEKAVKLAQQLKAMGKISELIGKRAEQVTGESMIEVQSGNQKLRTDLKNQTATHGEGTGEVSRDEIPLSVQAYVQEYFQQVRRTGGEAATQKATKKPAPAPKPQ